MAQLVKTVSGLPIASVKTVNGLAIAFVKTVMGLDNTSGGGGGMTISGSGQDNANTSTTTIATNGTLTILTNDIVVAMFIGEDENVNGALSIANSGTAMTWNIIAITNTTSNCKVGAWWAKSAGNENRTVTVTCAGVGGRKAIRCRVHTGANQTDPCPAAKVFSGVGGTDISQSITPSATGSALWMAAGDWGATNSFAAIANCTLEGGVNVGGAYTGTLVRPTTQPRTDGAAFTIGETDTGGTIAWVAFEVRTP